MKKNCAKRVWKKLLTEKVALLKALRAAIVGRRTTEADPRISYDRTFTVLMDAS